MIGVDVYLWNKKIGTVSQQSISDAPLFEYDKGFIKSGIELSPVVMPLSEKVYFFPRLAEKTFHGLPGLLADSLPDKFGNRLIDDYLSRQGRSIDDLTAVERLCYVGSRGMGALEFRPQTGLSDADQSLDIDDLARLAEAILSNRRDVQIQADENAIGQLIKVGTSAGGARAKALIAWNEETGDIRSGQIDAGNGYGYWLLKFGNVTNNKDKDVEADRTEYSKIEYAYSLMAKDCGIQMTDCRLIKSEEGYHFATRRFDRDKYTGGKLHMQSLGGLAHYDFNDAGAHSYEDAARIIRLLKLPESDIEQLFRRMVFNEVAKNYDDHVKNISFLMNKKGEWWLAPAYDMTFSYNPKSLWTASHQMKINGKRDSLSLEDLFVVGERMNLSKKKVLSAIMQIVGVVREWERYAEYVELDKNTTKEIKKHHRYSDSFTDYVPILTFLDEAINRGPAYTELATKTELDTR